MVDQFLDNLFKKIQIHLFFNRQFYKILCIRNYSIVKFTQIKVLIKKVQFEKDDDIRGNLSKFHLFSRKKVLIILSLFNF